MEPGLSGWLPVQSVRNVPGRYPSLVEVRPGLFVIADYHEPVFFADNFYWRFHAGRWYRSTWYGGGWVLARPPSIVVSVDRPHRYVRYRPAPRDRVVVRDHRGRWRR